MTVQQEKSHLVDNSAKVKSRSRQFSQNQVNQSQSVDSSGRVR